MGGLGFGFTALGLRANTLCRVSGFGLTIDGDSTLTLWLGHAR